MPIIAITHQTYCAEASDLNWRPGFWPENFSGIGQTWQRVRPVIDETENEVVAMKYRSLNTGAVLTVWND